MVALVRVVMSFAVFTTPHPALIHWSCRAMRLCWVLVHAGACVYGGVGGGQGGGTDSDRNVPGRRSQNSREFPLSVQRGSHGLDRKAVSTANSFNVKSISAVAPLSQE